MRVGTQKSFFSSKSEHSAARISHGGTTRVHQRKIYRPLNPRKPVHLTLKSSQAKGRFSLLGARNTLAIRSICSAQAAKFQITIQGYENVGNHLHFVLRFKSKELFQRFLKAVTGMISRFVTGARKGKPFGKRFWDHLAFTRVVMGRTDERAMQKYLDKNAVERIHGPAMRSAAELYEQAAREARRNKITIKDVMDRWLAKLTKI